MADNAESSEKQNFVWEKKESARRYKTLFLRNMQ